MLLEHVNLKIQENYTLEIEKSKFLEHFMKVFAGDIKDMVVCFHNSELAKWHRSAFALLPVINNYTIHVPAKGNEEIIIVKRRKDIIAQRIGLWLKNSN